MKLKRLFASLGLGLFALASVGAALLASPKASEVKAETPGVATTIYFDKSACSFWDTAGALTYVYTYDTSDARTIVTTVNHLRDNLYSFELGADKCKFFIARINPDNTEQIWTQTYDVEYESDHNFYRLYKNEYEDKVSYNVSYLAKYDLGSQFVVDLQAASTDWKEANAHCYLYWTAEINSNSSTKGAIDLGAISTTDAMNIYYESNSSSVVYANKLVVVRHNPAYSFDGTNWEHVWNQSYDIELVPSNSSCSYIKLGGNSEGKYGVTGFEQVTVSSFADSYSYQFLEADLCNDAGGLSEHFETNWVGVRNLFNNYKSIAENQFSLDLKTYLKTVSTSGVLNENKAMKRYDTAIVKNHLALADYDFIERSPSGSGAAHALSSQDTTTLISTITIVTVIAVSAVLIFVFTRRRKED